MKSLARVVEVSTDVGRQQTIGLTYAMIHKYLRAIHPQPQDDD
jgi:hypothetical protein